MANRAMLGILADPSVPENLKTNLTWGAPRVLDYVEGALLAENKYGEEVHTQKKTSLPGYHNQAVGNNPGTNHPQYYWQEALAWYRFIRSNARPQTGMVE
jgi:hypothetical protein